VLIAIEKRHIELDGPAEATVVCGSESMIMAEEHAKGHVRTGGQLPK